MTLPLEQLEAEALELPEQARARLVERLLRSFSLPTGMDAAVAQDWLDEAEHRDKVMDRGEEGGTPAHEVLRRLDHRRE